MSISRYINILVQGDTMGFGVLKGRLCVAHRSCGDCGNAIEPVIMRREDGRKYGEIAPPPPAI